VEDQRDRFMRKEWDGKDELKCGISGKPIKITDDWNVDHKETTFGKILSQFLQDREGLSKDQVEVVDEIDGTCRLADEHLRDEFRRLHEEVAKLQIVLSSEHKAKTAEQNKASAGKKG